MCGCIFKEYKCLSYHEKWECGKQLKCNNCRKQFSTRLNLLKHYRANPTHVKAGVKRDENASPGPHHYCKCGRSFEEIKTLKFHVKWECGKLIACKKCGNTYRQRRGLQRHFKHHPSHDIVEN